jgi:hypothetical protein
MARSMASLARIFWPCNDLSRALSADHYLPRCEKNSYDDSAIITDIHHIWSYLEDYIRGG